MSKYIGDITIGDLWKVEDYLDTLLPQKYNQQSILNLDLKIIALEFLNYFIEEDVFTKSYKELYKLFCHRFAYDEVNNDMTDLSQNEKSFYTYICKTYLYIEKNGNIEKINNIKKIIDDLRLIKQNIDDYNYLLIKTEKEDLLEGKKYKKLLLKYYINKNKEAEEQIINYLRSTSSFLTTKNRNTLERQFGLLYPFSFKKQDYSLENFSILKHKLLNCKIYRFYELEKLFFEDKDNFIIELKKEIEVPDIIDEIIKCSKINSYLNIRKNILEDTLELFRNSKCELFNIVAPLQIEGIIHDFCLEYGIKEKSLLNSSLVQMIDLIKPKNNNNKGSIFNFNYEYFEFIFPTIRNPAAHGKIKKTDIELTSFLMLLDLQYVCNLMFDSGLETNKDLSLIRMAKQNSQLIDMIKLGHILKNNVNPFYSEEFEFIKELPDKLKRGLNLEQFNKVKSTIEQSEIEDIKNNLICIKEQNINTEECRKILVELKK